MPLTPDRASLIGRIGAHMAHAGHDSRELTARARDTFLAKFEQEADPDGVLCPEERRRRAKHLRSAHFARLAALSAESRTAKQSAAQTAATSGTEAADAA